MRIAEKLALSARPGKIALFREIDVSITISVA